MIPPSIEDVPVGMGGTRPVIGKPGAKVVIIGWERETDEIIEFALNCVVIAGVLTRRAPNSDDREWLRNIGAQK